MRRVAVALVALWCMADSARAHRVGVSALVQGRRVIVRGFLASGGAPKNCPVTVTQADGTTLVEGKTDEAGRFEFETDARVDLTIVMDAGAGHRATCTLTADELARGATAGAAPARVPPPALPAAAGAVPPPLTPPAAHAALPDREGLERLIRAAVQEEVLPLREDLMAAGRRGPGPTEIAGGIGYIVGIMGLVMYVHSRRPQRASQDRP